MAVSEISIEQVVEAIKRYLASGLGEAAVSEALNFEVRDLRLKRAPSASDLPAAELRSTLLYWQSLPQVGGVAEGTKIDPSELRHALGYLMLVDSGLGPFDFRYALYGTKIAEVAGFDMTGKTVWDFTPVSAVQTFFAACYRAICDIPGAVYTVHKAPPQITASHWHRVILPLGENGTVKRFLVCNTPILEGRVVS